MNRTIETFCLLSPEPGGKNLAAIETLSLVLCSLEHTNNELHVPLSSGTSQHSCTIHLYLHHFSYTIFLLFLFQSVFLL